MKDSVARTIMTKYTDASGIAVLIDADDPAAPAHAMRTRSSRTSSNWAKPMCTASTATSPDPTQVMELCQLSQYNILSPLWCKLL